MENLQPGQLCRKPIWLYTGEIVIHRVANGPLLLLGFKGVSPLKVICHLGWFDLIQAMIDYRSSSSGVDLANQKRAFNLGKMGRK